MLKLLWQNFAKAEEGPKNDKVIETLVAKLRIIENIMDLLSA